jgi:hypothetical protein
MDNDDGKATIAELKKFVTRYAEGFAGDPAVTVGFYAEPMIYVDADAVSVLATRQDQVAFVEEMQRRLRPSGFAHTTVERCEVLLLKPTVALCRIAGIRHRADGSEIERIAATYVLTAHSEWRIRELIATDPVGRPQGRPHSGRECKPWLVGIVKRWTRGAKSRANTLPKVPPDGSARLAQRMVADDFPGRAAFARGADGPVVPAARFRRLAGVIGGDARSGAVRHYVLPRKLVRRLR